MYHVDQFMRSSCFCVKRNQQSYFEAHNLPMTVLSVFAFSYWSDIRYGFLKAGVIDSQVKTLIWNWEVKGKKREGRRRSRKKKSITASKDVFWVWDYQDHVRVYSVHYHQAFKQGSLNALSNAKHLTSQWRWKEQHPNYKHKGKTIYIRGRLIKWIQEHIKKPWYCARTLSI